LTKYNVSEIGFYLRPQVKPTQLGPIDRASPYLRTPGSDPIWIRNVVFCQHFIQGQDDG
jgi:hypothetical protein